jgi:hypothetical protein
MEFNAEPYWDDFEASNGAKDKNYMRILFRPGYAVQARELTQIQSALQNQIKNFADHIFKDGSPVYGGQLSLDTDVTYLKLQKSYGGVDIDLQDFENTIILNASGSAKIRARVLSIDETQTQPTLMVRYLRGTQFTAGAAITTPTGAFAQIMPSDFTGKGSIVSINEGIFYVDGYFVKVSPQTLVLSAYNRAPTFKIGLEIDDDIVDESADANLLDPAQSSFNFQAPGAHRYKFALRLAKRSLDSLDDEKFFELLRIENGVITKQVYYPIYSEIEKTLARRTYDESGDYIVNNFDVSVEANSANDSAFTINIEPGKAYVKGFEFETQGTQKITLNKARTANTSTDYDLSLEYGNYLIANNFITSQYGFFDISTLTQLDLHCVPRANVANTTLAGYYSTYIGNTKIMNVDRYNNSEYLVYLADTKLQANTLTTVGLATNVNSIMFPGHYSSLDNAYANILIRIASGNSSGEVRTISSYNGATRTAFVSPNFPFPIESSANVVLNYNTTNINSLIEFPGTAAAPIYSSLDIGPSSKDSSNRTTIYDTNRKSLLFRLPETYVANASITNADYIARKYYVAPSATGSNGEIDITLSGGETFPYGTDSQLLSGAVANTNFIVTAKSVSGTGNVSVGEVINMNGPRRAIRRLSSTQIKLFTDANTAFTPEVIFTVKVNNSESAIRSKTVVGNPSLTALRGTDVPTNGTLVVGDSRVRVDTANGFVWFNANTISSASGTSTSLYVPDVYRIKKILDSGNATYPPAAANTNIDITDRFYLDSGQTTTFYDHAKLVLKPGASAPKGNVVVMMQYYQHGSGSGYFTVDSYPASHYASGTIPLFIDNTGQKYYLRDCIDFRPTRELGTAASVASYTFVGMRNPKPTDPLELSYSYYLPRTDKILLTKDREIKVISGVPSRNPIPPNDVDNAMTLFKIDIPAYTADVRDVKVTTIENKRYTMRDIGNLDTRVKNVEYYTALSLLEKKAASATILYKDNATEKDKYGIVTDNFTGFDVADFSSDDFTAAIDSGKMFPYADINFIPFKIRTIGAYAQKNSRTISLSYTETSVIEQTTATTTVSVQPYLYGVFDGNLRLIPDTDSWFSTTLTPTVTAPVSPIATVDTTTVISSPVGTTTTVNASGVIGSSPTTTTQTTWFGGGGINRQTGGRTARV